VGNGEQMRSGNIEISWRS